MASLVAGGVACVSIVLIALSDGGAWVFLFVVAGIVLATIQLTAVWAVLGPGTYWKRSVNSMGLGAIVFVGVMLGILIGTIGKANLDDALTFTVTTLVCLPGVSLVAQVPNWICRQAFGWSIGLWRKETRTEPLTISDMMMLTAWVALAIGGVQLLMNLGDPLQGEESLAFLLFLVIPWSVLSWAIWLLFTMPAMLLILRPAPQEDIGCFQYIGVAVAAVVLVGAPLLLLTGDVDAVFTVLAGTALAYCLPIGLITFFSRRNGFVLWTRRRRKRWVANPPVPFPDDPEEKTAESNEADPSGLGNEPPAT